MTDNTSRIDDIRSKLGLVLGRDLPTKNKAKTAETDAPHPTDYAPVSLRSECSLLSDALSAQLRARLGLGEASPENVISQNAGNAVEVHELFPGQLVGDGDSGFFLYRRHYPSDYEIGRVPLGKALACAGREIALSACDTELNAFEPRSACYMDTETTGLAGGAGTVAFLVGMGFFVGDQFCLEQCFLRDYDDEPAMIAYLAERLAPFKTIISYNGKSFDVPLLRARFVQHRLPFPLEDTAHFDLVHAARRVWKKRLSDCSLGNIEREVLGLRREGDVPGYLVPQLWLEYLDSRDARPLEGVFYHHETDILSLAALAGHLAERLAVTDGPAFFHGEDQLSVIRLHYKNKDYPGVVDKARCFLEASLVRDELRRECLTLLAQACKRTGLFEDMRRAWEMLHEEYPEDAYAAGELAKYLEHQLHDWDAAIRVCRETLAALATQRPAPSDFGASALRGRVARIERKQTRRNGADSGDNDMFSSP